MNLLLIDNYDSFTFNLVQVLGELGALVDVVRNDAITAGECVARNPAALVVSPGPGRPEQAGVSVEAVRRCGEAGIPVLGVCLGLQAIAAAFGGEVVRARAVLHGKTCRIHHDGRGIFRELANPFEATRYHSLVMAEASCPASLEITARSDPGEVMAIRHRSLPIHGVQFHPESILSAEGKNLLRNFLGECAQWAAA